MGYPPQTAVIVRRARPGRSSRTTLGNPLLVASAAVATVQHAGNLLASVGHLFSGGGGSRDAARKARADFFRDAALAGCVAAARYLLGGLQNVASNERGWYDSAWSSVQSQRPDVAGEAQGRAQWVASDDAQAPAAQQQMIVAVQRELQTLQTTAAQYVPPANTGGQLPTSGGVFSPGTPTTRPTTTLPAVRTTAPFNWDPYLIGAGIVGAVLILPTLMRKR